VTEGEDGDGEHEAFEDEPTRAKGDKPLCDEIAGDELPHGDLPHDELAHDELPHDELAHGDLPHDDELTTVHEPRPDESARLVSIVESLLFASDKPLTLKSIGDLLGETDLGKIRAAVASVEEAYAPRGVQLHSVAGGYQFRTNADNASWVQKLLAQKPVRLTRAQLETLAIVAYRQPITRPEIDQIRGVDSGGTLKTLMDRLLLRILGKKEEPGRPLLYGTTKEFLDFFSLKDLRELPTLREYSELTDESRQVVDRLEPSE